MTQILNFLLIVFLIICAVLVEQTKDLLSAVIIFTTYSLAMSAVWLLLHSPDVAMTEAAVGAGITTIMFIAALSRTSRKEQ